MQHLATAVVAVADGAAEAAISAVFLAGNATEGVRDGSVDSALPCPHAEKKLLRRNALLA